MNFLSGMGDRLFLCKLCDIAWLIQRSSKERVRPMKAFFSILLLIAIFTLGASEISACLCEPVKPKQRVKYMKKNADAIFIGTVSSVEDGLRERKARLRMTKLWKGQVVEFFDIYTTASNCGVYFEVGKRYLVFTKTGSNGRLTTVICFGTRVAELANEEIKWLGKPAHAVPEK